MVSMVNYVQNYPLLCNTTAASAGEVVSLAGQFTAKIVCLPPHNPANSHKIFSLTKNKVVL